MKLKNVGKPRLPSPRTGCSSTPSAGDATWRRWREPLQWQSAGRSSAQQERERPSAWSWMITHQTSSCFVHTATISVIRSTRDVIAVLDSRPRFLSPRSCQEAWVHSALLGWAGHRLEKLKLKLFAYQPRLVLPMSTRRWYGAMKIENLVKIWSSLLIDSFSHLCSLIHFLHFLIYITQHCVGVGFPYLHPVIFLHRLDYNSLFLPKQRQTLIRPCRFNNVIWFQP